MSTFANTMGRVDKVPACTSQDGDFGEWAFRARASLAMLYEDADDYMEAAEQLPSVFNQGSLIPEAWLI